jgi:hypothetical protein
VGSHLCAHAEPRCRLPRAAQGRAAAQPAKGCTSALVHILFGSSATHSFLFVCFVWPKEEQ